MAALSFAAMKPKLLLLILPAAIFLACKPAGEALPTCPPGTRAVGEPPPEGQEVSCAKVADGKVVVDADGKPVKEGPFVLFRPDGSKMMQGSYRDGKQDGEWTLWYENGVKQSLDHYRNGLQNGDHSGWYPDGKIAAMGKYRDGKREGAWKRWDPQGFRNWEEIYRDDKKIQ